MATIAVRGGDNLQKAVDQAADGDVLVVDPVAFPGPLRLGNRGGNGAPVTIQTAALGQLPGSGGRVDPTQAPLMPTITSPGDASPALWTSPGARGWTLLGLAFQPALGGTTYDLLTLGDGSSAQFTLAAVPSGLVLDRCLIRAQPGSQIKRGVALNSAATRLLGCHIADFKVAGQDSQAVCGWNGPGPYEITNCYLEAAGENVMFGGAPTSIPNLVPADITITGCTFTKQLAWNPNSASYAGTHYTVKNLLELKNAQHVKVVGNHFGNNWADPSGQTGGFFLITPRGAQSGGPWCLVQDVEFRDNTANDCCQGIMILGSDDNSDWGTAQDILIRNNILDVATGDKLWGDVGTATLFQLTTGRQGGVRGLTIDHNTSTRCQKILIGEGTHTGLVISNNLLNNGVYGILANSQEGGSVSLNSLDPHVRFLGNVVVGAPPKYYPVGNFYPSTWDEVGVVDPLAGRLTKASPYAGTATDGGDPGVTPPAAAPATPAAVPTQLTLTLPASIVKGDTSTVARVKVTAADSSTPTGTVTLRFGTLGPFEHSLQNGQTGYMLASLEVGTYEVEANYPAQGGYAVSPPVQAVLTVAAALPPPPPPPPPPALATLQSQVFDYAHRTVSLTYLEGGSLKTLNLAIPP